MHTFYNDNDSLLWPLAPNPFRCRSQTRNEDSFEESSIAFWGGLHQGLILLNCDTKLENRKFDSVMGSEAAAHSCFSLDRFMVVPKTVGELEPLNPMRIMVHLNHALRIYGKFLAIWALTSPYLLYLNRDIFNFPERHCILMFYFVLIRT